MLSVRSLKAWGLFVISYALLYVLYASQDFLPKWDIFGVSFLKGQAITGYAFIDPLFLIIPVIGFWLMWWALEWYSNYFKDEFVFGILFALVFMVASYVVWLVALMGYYWNNAFLVAVAQGNPNPASASFGQTMSFAFEKFFELLLQSPYFVFVLSGLLAWISFVIVHKYWNESLPQKSLA